MLPNADISYSSLRTQPIEQQGQDAVYNHDYNESSAKSGDSRRESTSHRLTKLRQYRVFSKWSWEVASLALTLLLFVAMAILLYRFDGTTAPNWGRYMNFNTVLALLSTVFRASLVVVITQIISQRRWSWFAPPTPAPRPLGHLQQYDEGSRNSFMAVWLFGVILKGKDVVGLLAAIIFLASFLVGPFVQQASQTISCTVRYEEASASIPFARYVPRADGFRRGVRGFGAASPDLIVALLSSVTATKGVENQVNAICATGNCTFPIGDSLPGDMAGNDRGDEGDVAVAPPNAFLTANTATTHTTVGVCHACSDISPAIRFGEDRNGNKNATLRNMTVSIAPYGPALNMTSAPLPFGETLESFLIPELITDEMLYTSRYALSQTTILLMTGTPAQNGDSVEPRPTGYMAANCQLYPCLRTVSSVVHEGEVREVESAESLSTNLMDRMGRQMWPARNGTLEGNNASEISMVSASAEGGSWDYYAAVKSPCWITDEVGGKGQIYTRTNMSQAPGANDFILYQPRLLPLSPADTPPHTAATTQDDPEYHWVQYRVPEACIYRHNAEFATAISRVLEETILRGACVNDPGSGQACVGDGITASGSGDIPALETTMTGLFAKGNATIGTLREWFGGFAGALTQRYRFQYGANLGKGGYNATAAKAKGVELARGVVEGVAWQTEVCITADMRWLLMPGLLLACTTVLFVWTVWETWVSRWERPVWKDNLLVYLFYHDRFGTGLQQDARRRDCDRLLETEEMEQIADQTMVMFDWSANTSGRSLIAEGLYLNHIHGARKKKGVDIL